MPSDDVSTVAQIKYAPSPLPAASYTLTVARGMDAGKTLTIDGLQPSRVLVGQSAVCSLRLTDSAVSRRHAALEVSGSFLHLVDLGSTNGTRVSGVRVADALLEGGESVEMGATMLRVVRGPAPAEVNLPTIHQFGRMLGYSREMRRLYETIARIAQSNVPVIIEGETGTGKEALAEAIHEEGPRVDGPFLVFDCTAVAPSIAETELFGHERGAFTGAVAARRGIFEQAQGGTLLIDEIGDLDISLQSKLLRAIERGEIRRMGGDRTLKVDVRMIAATRRDLDDAVLRGRFRDDLYHRLAVARIDLPPLRERKGDITMLAHHFAKELGGALPAAVITQWENYPWPGNVRELRNAVSRYLALGQDIDLSRRVSADPEEDPIARVIREELPFVQAKQRVVDEFEQRYLTHVLDAHGGNVSKAAAASGIGRRYFHMILARARRE